MPSVQFASATLEEAVEFIRSSVNNACWDDYPVESLNIVLIPGPVPSTAEISLELKDVPVGEALRYIAELSGFTVTVEPHAVVLRPTSACIDSELFTRTFMLEPSYGKQLAVDADARAWMSQAGVDFPEGSSARTSNEGSQVILVVKSTAARLKKIEAWLVQQSAWIPPSVAVAETEVAARQFKLDRLDASGASLQELADYIRSQAPDLDIQVQAGKGQNEGSITLELRHVPLWEALQYLAEMSGYRLLADDKTIRLMR